MVSSGSPTRRFLDRVILFNSLGHSLDLVDRWLAGTLVAGGGVSISGFRMFSEQEITVLTKDATYSSAIVV